MSQLELRDIRKTYPGALDETLKGINIDIASGEFLTLVGPSGCGKSTLMNSIAGLESITGGSIVVEGKDISTMEPKVRDIAMVFQSYALYPTMSVRENIAFGLKIRGMPKDEIQQEVERVADLLQISALLDKKPARLSGGQQQRVAMGRALARRPKIYLFDEPLSNLDAKLRARTRIELRGLHDKLGATSIFVTHDQIEAMTMADRIVLLDQGRIQQVGSPREIYEKPCNRFVASFIGSPEINLLEGNIRNEGGVTYFEQFALRGTRPDIRNGPFALGVRPDGFDVSRRPLEGGIPLAVDAIEYTGSDTFVFGGGPMGQLTVKIDADGQDIAEDLRPGETLHVRPAFGAWHLFDASGSRVPEN